MKAIPIPDPPKIVPFTFGGSALNEGDYAQVSCVVSSGDLPLSISWSLQSSGSKLNGSVSQNDQIMTAPMGKRASFLSISSVGHSHSGIYTCTAKNSAGLTSHSAELKVNGQFIL